VSLSLLRLVSWDAAAATAFRIWLAVSFASLSPPPLSPPVVVSLVALALDSYYSV